MTRALLVGTEPDRCLPYAYVKEPPYEGVVIGSLSLSQLLRFREDQTAPMTVPIFIVFPPISPVPGV